MASTPALPPKKDVMLALLERSSVYIHLDPRPADVRVPQWFKKQPQLVLQVGLNMAVRIPDLEVAEDAVSCTLSFSRSPFFCYVPWKAVFALVAEDGKAMLWPDDVPPEVAAQHAELAQKEQARDRLRAVSEPGASKDLAPADASAKKPETAKSAGKKRGPSRLRAEKSSRTEEPRKEPAEPARPGSGRDSKRQLPPYLRIVK